MPNKQQLKTHHSSLKTILVTGSNGQLGSELKELINNPSPNYSSYHPTSNIQHPTSHSSNISKFTFTTKKELDLSSKQKIQEYFKDKNFDILINCAAYTAVDKAEEEKELADQINHQAVKQLAQISKEKDIKLIHISTDYVYDGTNHKPYLESDKTNPKSVYGQTKLAGENAILKIHPQNSIIIRTSWVYSAYGKNFVKTILKLAQENKELNIVNDQIGSPTYAKDLAKAILTIITPNSCNPAGTRTTLKTQNLKLKTRVTPQEQGPNSVVIYHYSNEGVLSWYDFAKEIVKIAKLNCQINPIPTKDYPTPASRPMYTVLSKDKIKKDYNLSIPIWKKSLRHCLSKILNDEY